VSVVVPVFGMFIVGSAAVGVVFLDESLTARKVVGVALAVVAVYLVSVEP
jgi:transporter family protein